MPKDQDFYEDGVYIGKIVKGYIYDHEGRYAGRVDFGDWVWDRDDKFFGKDPKKDPKKLLKSYLKKKSA